MLVQFCFYQLAVLVLPVSKRNFEPEPNAAQLTVHHQSAPYQFLVVHTGCSRVSTFPTVFSAVKYIL